ncbi:MAG: hypothetical protein L3K16_07190 [Thermoplasmata archaeon]|nr:hypothetical protein [Thermoplasmata archaeon]
MCANDRTPIGPELALLSQRTPLSLQDAQIRGVLYDELDGASAEWTFDRERTPAPRPPRFPRWMRLFGRGDPPPCVSRSEARVDGPDPLGFPGPTPGRPTGVRP